MQILGISIRPLMPPKDSLTDAIAASKLALKNGDIVAISSKVVSIHEGRCVPAEGIDRKKLIKQEADWFYLASKTARWRNLFTISKGALVGSAGIDESNGDGHFILYPEDPFKSARTLRAWLMKQYKIKEIAVIITDSASIPMRRGSVGFALAWDGIDPMRDYRGMPDIFGRILKIEVANLIDPLAAAAVLEMGEGDERTPVAVIRGAKNIRMKNSLHKSEALIVSPEDDLFAPLIWRKGWKKGSGTIYGKKKP